MTAQLAGHDYDHTEDVDDSVRSHVFTGGLRAMWAPGAAATVRFSATGTVTATDIMGRTRTVDTTGGTGEVTLTGDVIYLSCDISDLTTS